MKTSFPLLILIALLIVSCSQTKLQDEVALYTEESNEPLSLNSSVTAFELDVFDAINSYRKSIGLSKLSFSEDAYPVAGEHNKYMISKKKLSHDNFSKRASKISKKTKAKFVAENIAKNYDTADELLQAWLDSNNHRKTIEGNFTHTTISIEKSSEGNYYFTQIFFR